MSPMKAARLSIVDLPTNILLEIFDSFKHEPINYLGFIEELGEKVALSRLRDIQNARLACRVFHEFASPHLCPVLSLPIGARALSVIDAMLGNPFILKGVRLLEVSTAYRPKILAHNLTRYKEHRLAFLDQLLNRVANNAGDMYDSDDEESVLQWSTYYNVRHHFLAIREVWCPNSSHFKEETSREEELEYQRVLDHGYAEYRKRHEEQVRLISDGSFAKAIATLVSRLPRWCSLEFSDRHATDTTFQYERDPALLLTDIKELTQFMSSPHDWRTIYELGEESDLAPAMLFSTIPIAIHEQGATLRSVHIGSFLRPEDYKRICGQPQALSWDDLSASCKQLKGFGFADGPGVHYQDIRLNHPQGEEKACIERYFSAMLSSSQLELMNLNLRFLQLADRNNGRPVLDQHLNMEIGSVLRSTAYPHLKRATISHVSMRQIDLEGFCNGIGSRLLRLCLSSVEILDGHWFNTIEILRRKFLVRCLEGRCEIALYRLYGGEFGSREVRPLRRWSLSRRYEPPVENFLLVRSREYINGDAQVQENPLK